ncbi:MAG: hypothetical protein FD165_1109 [Gammaproteobacteria bacterium]|nr:MAG: hypothetical protein FD165_1109 [Gammaproteobacteria bacterium]TND07268.1 MAG: hypothetical protein FD120_6 [Gammaproteobacteria bacterium]
MFSDISSESTERIKQSTLLLGQIRLLDEESDNAVNELLKTQKGMFFISIYASLEYSIVNSCSKFLSLIERDGFFPMKFKNNLLCILLDPEFNSVIGCGKKKVWEKKGGLIERLFSEEPVQIDNTVFPSDGINIGKKQLEDVWTFMHLPGEPIPAEENEWYLKEIKEHRNAIAHGRVTAADVGKRYTYGDLEKRHNFISALCGHVISSFETHARDHSYLRETEH